MRGLIAPISTLFATTVIFTSCSLITGGYEADLDGSTDTDTDTNKIEPKIAVFENSVQYENGDTCSLGEASVDGPGGLMGTPREIFVRNDGKKTLQLQTPTLSGPDVNEFTINLDAFDLSLDQEEVTSFVLNLDPSNFKELSAVVNIESNDPVNSKFTLELGGIGIDNTPPLPGNGDPTISKNALTPTNIVFNWLAATDNKDPSNELEYMAVSSQNPNIASVEEALANGNVFMDWTKGALETEFNSFDPGEPYSVNVLVRDLSGNISAYEMISFMSPNVIYMFATSSMNGNLSGARSAADAECEDAHDDYPSLPWGNIMAFISCDGDPIVSMTTNYGVPSDRLIVGPTGMVVSPDWAGLFDGSIDQTLSAAGICSFSAWWSGSQNNGAAALLTCDNWSSNSDTNGGQTGSCSATDSQWLSQTLPSTCNSVMPRLCLAWE